MTVRRNLRSSPGIKPGSSLYLYPATTTLHIISYSDTKAAAIYLSYLAKSNANDLGYMA